MATRVIDRLASPTLASKLFTWRLMIMSAPIPVDRVASQNSPLRILVIDDSKTVIRAIVRGFANTAYRVETVGHYLEIPRYLRQTPPDLVILDLSMPGISGERISDFIRRDQRRDTPIVIYSSLSEETLEAAAARTQAVGWVSKRQPLDQLLALVEQTLAQRRGGHRP
jgi:two-component system, OmpR family, response regulator MprA